MDGEKCHRKTHENYGKPVIFLTVPIHLLLLSKNCYYTTCRYEKNSKQLKRRNKKNRNFSHNGILSRITISLQIMLKL